MVAPYAVDDVLIERAAHTHATEHLLPLMECFGRVGASGSGRFIVPAPQRNRVRISPSRIHPSGLEVAPARVGQRPPTLG